MSLKEGKPQSKKKRFISIPAPLEPDSDDDFNEAIVVIEDKKSRLKKKKGKSRTQTKSNAAGRSQEDGGSTLRNLLGSDLDIGSSGSDSSGAEEDAMEVADSNADEDSFAEGEGFEDEGYSPRKPRSSGRQQSPPFWRGHGSQPGSQGQASQKVSRSTSRGANGSPKEEIATTSGGAISSHAVKPTSSPSGDALSDTESEPDLVFIPPSTNANGKRTPPTRVSPPPKRPKLSPPLKTTKSAPKDEEGSVTEDEEPIIHNFATKPLPQDVEESETESEEELDIGRSLINYPKPALTPRHDQHSRGPLILDETRKIQVPAHLNRFLRDYQRDGIKFFYERWNEGRGGILGDDMGLGKTIQVIAFLTAIMQKKSDVRDENRRQLHVRNLQNKVRNEHLPPADATWKTCLIIAPSTVVGNWERELEKWGYFETGIYIGSKEERSVVLKDFKMGRLDIVLTSHTTARNDIDLIDDLAWSCVFVDEVHKIKNSQSGITKAYNRFKCQVRFGLTGTALQNSYKELWPLLDWSNPGRVSTEKHWKRFVTKPLTAGQASGCTQAELADARIVANRLVNRLLPVFFLRRTKELIMDQLPRKIDQVVFCPLTPTQIQVYKRFITTEDVQLMIHKDDPCDCGRTDKSGKRNTRGRCCYSKNSEGVHWKSLVLKYMDIFLKISNHLLLIYPGKSDTPEQQIRNRKLVRIAFPDDPDSSYTSVLMRWDLCGKYQILKRLLVEWQGSGDNKVLIFSRSVKILEFLKLWLSHDNVRHIAMDGSTPQSERMGLVDQFNNDPDVFAFLISTLTGGTGLNLTSANKVIIFDPNWNPAHDMQAMDRAYRFGQLRDVSVYRLLGAGSLEELIYARQLYKQQQMNTGYTGQAQTRYFNAVQGDKNRQGELFGVKNIFTLQEEDLATKYTIEKAHQAALEWAMAHMPSDSKGNGASDYAGVRGLGALMLEDADDPLDKDALVTPKDDEIQKILNSLGVKYTHNNEAILKPTKVENKLGLEAIKGKRKARDKAKITLANETVPIPSRSKRRGSDWPPKRHVKDANPSPDARLASRQQALLILGLISGPHDMGRFAEDFMKKTEEEQNALFARLDETARKHNL